MFYVYIYIYIYINVHIIDLNMLNLRGKFLTFEYMCVCIYIYILHIKDKHLQSIQLSLMYNVQSIIQSWHINYSYLLQTNCVRLRWRFKIQCKLLINQVQTVR